MFAATLVLVFTLSLTFIVYFPDIAGWFRGCCTPLDPDRVCEWYEKRREKAELPRAEVRERE